MPVKMSPVQLNYWQELLAPFHPDELSKVKKGGGRELTYVDARALMNRLDSVCGPHGWDIVYRETDRGYTARMGLLVPTSDNAFVWHYKEDGGGFEDMGMKNRETGEWEADIDNDEKSAYTNALRRVAQNAWGIGRYLYGKGIPAFLDPSAKTAAASPGPTPDPPGLISARENALKVERARSAPSIVPAPAPTPTPAPAPAPAKGQGNFRLPKPGKMVFAWAKEMEKTFETSLITGMGREGTKRGVGTTFSEWTQDQVDAICMDAIQHIVKLPTYQGQFAALLGHADKPAPAKEAGVNIAELRRTFAEKLKALILKQTGEPATTERLKAVFNTVAAAAANADGHTGEVPESLAKMTDTVWLANMIALVDKQIEVAVSGQPGDEIPF